MPEENDHLKQAIDNILDLKLSGFTPKDVYLSAISLGTQAAIPFFLDVYRSDETVSVPDGEQVGKFVADFAWTLCREAEKHIDNGNKTNPM